MIKQLIKTTTSLKNADIALLVLRIIGGGFMLAHGIPKLMKLFAGGEIQFANPFGIGAGPSLALTVFAEVLCAGLILIGLKTRLATIPLIITMLVAALMIHGADPFGKKELALMYLGVYTALLMLGSGKYSVDGALSKA